MAGFAVVDFFQAHGEKLRKALISSKITNSKTDLGNLQLKNFEEIGDGNLNFVYRIFLDVGGAAAISIVVKHAPDYIKVGRVFVFDANSLFILSRGCSALVPSIL